MTSDSDTSNSDEMQLQYGAQRHSLPTLSDTRWMARVDSISAFIANFEAVFNALEEVKLSSCPQSSADASSYIHSLGQFSFIYSAIVSQYVLSFIRPLTVALQASDCDLVECHNEAQSLIVVLRALRGDSQKHDMLYNRAVTTASRIEVEQSVPRCVKRQQHRANATVENASTQTHYQVK